MDLVQNLLIKIKKLSMDLVHDRGSMDPVHESGPAWTRSKEGVHGPLVHVLSSRVSTRKNGMRPFEQLVSFHEKMSTYMDMVRGI